MTRRNPDNKGTSKMDMGQKKNSEASQVTKILKCLKKPLSLRGYAQNSEGNLPIIDWSIFYENVALQRWYQHFLPLEAGAVRSQTNMGTDNSKVDGKPEEISSVSNEKKKQKIGGIKNLSAQFFVLIMTSLTLLSFVNACEVEIAVDSGNITLLCANGYCGAKSSAFKVRVGDEICIVYDEDKSVSMIVTEICRMRRYLRLNPTSSNANMTFTVCEPCNQKGDEHCDANGPCYDRAFESSKKSQIKDDKPPIVTCNKDVRGFDKKCLIFTTSIRLEDFYEMLGPTREFYHTSITLKPKGLDEELTFYEDALNPVALRLQNYPNLFISVMNSSIDEISTDLLLQYSENFYFVNKSVLRDLEESLLGNMQSALQYGNIKVNFSNTPQNKGSSKVPQTYRRPFSSRVSEFRKPKNVNVHRRDPLVVDTCESSGRDEAYIQLGTNVTDFGSELGKCEMTNLESFGCSSGNGSAAFLFNVTKVDKPGMIPFRSDCGFFVNSIPCNPGPFLLVLKKDAEDCVIRMPTLSRQFRVVVSKEQKLSCKSYE